ncbi:LOW QUALITY PROTEIN: glucose dehydrogenase [FAD, quinone]-like [Chelonus insularis]|uniref:LOW QUALITY PROTEIN: glucose dehydrogenase [FAD, quinone]-like n=1 Tax=Chelonus insularis TaxID=460826 RepID=UPI00158B0E58|nr:LOW QUALITY PROTEIN: glucose dehydrogenase [FAD, quinone]-like [Chelonus insularis]
MAAYMVIIFSLAILHFGMSMPPFDYLKNILNYFRQYPPFPKLYSNQEPPILSSYDFIIIGAGSGGSVVANRLTEIGDWKVLLLEAGKEEIFLTDWPLLAAAMEVTSYNWGYKTEPSSSKHNKNKGYCLSMINGCCNWPRGKAVGGTSVINFMIHSRGSEKDFNQWEANGNKGWSYRDVYPYFLKMEKLNINMNNEIKGINRNIHGKNGYLDVTFAPWTSKLRDKFLDAGEELGYNIKDCNEANPIGFCPAQVNLRHGRRVSAYKSYLRPIIKRKNFHLLKESIATQIVIDPITKVATGVKFVRNGKSFYIKANKEIILSAGSINSPQLLMLSGVGPKKHLETHGINVVQDLPVGFNLQDHISMAALTFLVNDSVTIVENRIATDFKSAFDYLAYGMGPLTVPSGAEALAFINTKKDYSKYQTNDSPENDDPDIELVFGIGSMAGDLSGTLRNIFNLPNKWFYEVFGNYIGRDAFSIVPVLLHPKSRGRVSLRSSNPFDPPILEANYFDDEEDLKTLVGGIKKAIKIASTQSFKMYNATLLPVKFPGCKHLEFNSDEYWACVCRQISTTLGHFVGTCKMAPREANGVVDHNLKVYGIERLRIVDASIIPSLIAGHTNAPAYMIGEKASDLIKDEWLREK